MALTGAQVKGKIKLKAEQTGADPRSLMRIYMMERFLERLSKSKYKDSFVIKGGILVTSMLGLSMRSTMDIDTTIHGFDLNENSVLKIVEEICDISTDDNITFEVNRVETIMDEMEYPGVRVHLNALCDKMKTPLKIDISTGDIITPKEIDYKYSLLLEDRSINLWAYNLETVLAEKIQTILVREVANTRMRDFYDVFALNNIYHEHIDFDTLANAFKATCQKRDTAFILENYHFLIDNIQKDENINRLWSQYQQKYEYAQGIELKKITEVVLYLMKKITFLD